MPTRTHATFGEQLRRARIERGLRQVDLAAEVGVSQSMLSRIELGRGGSVPLSTWMMVVERLGLQLALHGPLASDLTARCHRLLASLAVGGGWAAWTDAAANEATLLRTDRREAVIATVWDVIGSVASSASEFGRRLETERTERGPGWRVGGVVIIPSTGHARRRLTEEEAVANAAFPERGAHWLIALRGGRMPERPGLIWTDQRFERLRPMIPYFDRRRRQRAER